MDKVLQVRMQERDYEALQEVANEVGFSLSAIVRLILQVHIRRGREDELLNHIRSLSPPRRGCDNEGVE